MEVAYAPKFVWKLRSLPPRLQEEAIEKIEKFRDEANHRQLRVHKLHGRMEGRYSFSVNYSYRIVFRFLEMKPRVAVLLTIGDHDDYD